MIGSEGILAVGTRLVNLALPHFGIRVLVHWEGIMPCQATVLFNCIIFFCKFLASMLMNKQVILSPGFIFVHTFFVKKRKMSTFSRAQNDTKILEDLRREYLQSSVSFVKAAWIKSKFSNATTGLENHSDTAQQ